MKTLIPIIIFTCIGLFFVQCKEFTEIGDCNVDALFQIELQDPNCRDSCKITFINASTGLGELSYQWNFGGGNLSTEINPTHTFLTGTNEVVLTVLSEGCPQATFNKSVTIQSGLEPLANFEMSIEERCLKGDCNISFTNLSQNANSYEWDFGGLDSSMEENPSYNFIDIDTFQISLTANGSTGPPHTFTKQLIVRPITFPIKAYDLDQSSSFNEIVYGVDENSNGEIYLIMNNREACYLASVDKEGTPINQSIGFNLNNPSFDKLIPDGFRKTASGYYLVGRATKPSPDFDTDVFLFKASPNLSFGFCKSFAKPLDGGVEKGFDFAETANGEGVILGNAVHNSNQGIYVLEVQINSNFSLSHNYAFDSDDFSEGNSILKTDDGYWVAGLRNISGSNYETFFAVLGNNYVPIDSGTNIGSSSFSIKKMIQLNSNEAIIIGDENGVAKAMRINTNGAQAWPPTSYPDWIIRDVILTDNERLIMVGTQLSLGFPGWLEVNSSTGDIINSEPYMSDVIDEGDAFSIVETIDGGFLIAGRGREGTNKYQSILIKTDKDGIVDE